MDEIIFRDIGLPRDVLDSLHELAAEDGLSVNEMVWKLVREARSAQKARGMVEEDRNMEMRSAIVYVPVLEMSPNRVDLYGGDESNPNSFPWIKVASTGSIVGAWAECQLSAQDRRIYKFKCVTPLEGGGYKIEFEHRLKPDLDSVFNRWYSHNKESLSAATFAELREAFKEGNANRSQFSLIDDFDNWENALINRRNRVTTAEEKSALHIAYQKGRNCRFDLLEEGTSTCPNPVIMNQPRTGVATTLTTLGKNTPTS